MSGRKRYIKKGKLFERRIYKSYEEALNNLIK